MTTPGGEGEDQTPPEPEASAAYPVAPSEAPPTRGFDWVAALAWSAAVAVALVLGGLTAIGFQSIGEQRATIAGWWKSVAAERPHEPRGDDLVEVMPMPLPGRPPEILPTVGAGDEVEGAVVIANPSWLEPPHPEFPEAAMHKGIEEGRVQLQCPVSAKGTILSCWILEETPAGVGFGQAALFAASRSRLKPRTVDGEPVRGMVRFSVVFRLG
ncbi:MAG: energy transducer TonB [Caulobacteraceae bacterium]|nr:energy transducer TonB [Caulobacteraceae bacterium]